ncbi:MAG: M48 family metallopeptidase [Candidatus Sericytochromatia bacterium]
MPAEYLSLEINGQTYQVEHRVDRRLKHVYLQWRSDGIVLKSPGISRRRAESLLEEKKAWLARQLLNTPPPAPSRLPEQVALRGELYPLQLCPMPGAAPARVLLRDGQMCVELPEALSDRQELVWQALDRFWQAEARDYLHERMIFWSQRMGLAPRQIRLKRLKSRWGSCSARDNINLNYRAIQLPPACIDAILVHELAHLRHLNHGPHFWQLVHSYLPDYAERDALLKAWSPRVH